MLKKIKALVADIDGTLVMKGGELQPEIKKALETLHAQGVKIGVASGRPLDKRIKDKAHEWGLSFEFDMMIGMNGGDIWVEGMDEIQHNYLLGTDTLEYIMSWIKDFDCNAISYIKAYDEVWCTKVNPFMIDSQKRNKSIVRVVTPEKMATVPTGKIECQYMPEDNDKMTACVAEHIKGRTDFIAVKTFFTTVEFLDPRVNKGMALHKFCEISGIPIEEVLACGDMNNDFEMLRDAGFSICLANGCDECKEVATVVTELPCDQDGLGKYLNEVFIKG